MAKLTKNNSFISVVAIIIAVFALFAGVYAVMQVNANLNSSAGYSTAMSRCTLACGGPGCVLACTYALKNNTTCTAACQNLPSETRPKTCVQDCTAAVASLPSAQCANFCLGQGGLCNGGVGVGQRACSDLCKSIETGQKTCAQACGELNPIVKSKCLKTCPSLVVTK